MKSNEFCEGNYFFQIKGDKIVKLADKLTGSNMSAKLSTQGGVVTEENIHDAISGNNLRPIILTNQILNTICINEENGLFHFDKITVQMVKEGVVIRLLNSHTYNLSEEPEDIKYLHQLQNIYKSITNERLYIEPSKLDELIKHL